MIERIRAIKFANKTHSASWWLNATASRWIRWRCLTVRSNVFMNKRQLLNILHVIALYLDIKENRRTIAPKVHLFAG